MFKVGDKVTTKYKTSSRQRDDSALVREVVDVEYMRGCQSGWMVTTDCLGAVERHLRLDAAWYKPADSAAESHELSLGGGS
jgi:hypothetical protein